MENTGKGTGAFAMVGNTTISSRGICFESIWDIVAMQACMRKPMLLDQTQGTPFPETSF